MTLALTACPGDTGSPWPCPRSGRAGHSQAALLGDGRRGAGSHTPIPQSSAWSLGARRRVGHVGHIGGRLARPGLLGSPLPPLPPALHSRAETVPHPVPTSERAPTAHGLSGEGRLLHFAGVRVCTQSRSGAPVVHVCVCVCKLVGVSFHGFAPAPRACRKESRSTSTPSSPSTLDSTPRSTKCLSGGEKSLGSPSGTATSARCTTPSEYAQGARGGPGEAHRARSL